jgi:nucleotide-binding universal stress UspA family protein
MMTPSLGFGTILVPLDGSELAERALPVAERVARATDSALLLASVVRASHWNEAHLGYLLAPELYRQVLDAEVEGTRAYIRRIEGEVRGRGLRVGSQILRGEPVQALINLNADLPVGLMVLASHGRTGLARFAVGSVADRLMRHGLGPTLIVRPFGDDSRMARLERALVPLDGSALAELALGMVRSLAGRVLRTVTLVRVVDPDLHAGETTETQRYLAEVRGRLAAELAGCDCVVESRIVYGRVAEQILAYSEDHDIVVMATHGHTGATRWALGSVADRVLQQVRVPLLLVRPRTRP